MQVIFIRHASPEPAGSEGDAARELTEKGREEARATGKALKVLGVDLQRILSSPLVRAVQTGEILSQVHQQAEVLDVGFLVPPGDFEGLFTVLEDLANEGLETIALVGHTPSLGELLGMLVIGKPNIGVSLSKAGAACVVLSGGDEPPQLRWVMRRGQLQKLSQ